jgi:hypothetical protein
MARIHPDGWRELSASGAAERELQTLSQLAAGLTDRYSVYHGVHWTRASSSYSVVGEIDFVVVGPGSRILLIEQKSGFLSEGEDGLCKPYAGKTKNVPMQMARNARNFITRLQQSCRDKAINVESLLYCPDYTVRSPGTAGIDPARIVDARTRDTLLPTIRALLPDAAGAIACDPVIHRFLADLLELVPDVTAVVGEAEALSTRLSGGLAHWARQIDCQPQRLRVCGTAGSGKTQLALAVFRDALTAGRRPLYVCYNRPLADHIRRIVPEGGAVMSYHQLADEISRRDGTVPDFSQAGAFAALEAAFDRHQPDPSERFEVLIVDEGQDFKADWCRNLLRLLDPQGSAWWLEDPLQNLYEREPLELDGWVRIRADTNYRSPQDILAALNRLLTQPRELDSGSPITDSGIEMHVYRDADELVTRTVGAVTQAIGAGFRRAQIAIVTFRGREHSALRGRTRIGPYPLIAPTGGYDLFGNPLLSDGDIVIDSVHRFKGRGAACVVLTEVDFAELDTQATRRLFVGATRARLKLILVVSARSEALLRAAFDPQTASTETP